MYLSILARLSLSTDSFWMYFQKIQHPVISFSSLCTIEPWIDPVVSPWFWNDLQAEMTPVKLSTFHQWLKTHYTGCRPFWNVTDIFLSFFLAPVSKVARLTVTKFWQRLMVNWICTRNTLDCDQCNYSSCIVFSYVPIEFGPTGNSAIRSADPKHPTLEPNMEWIGWSIAEIWPFEIFRMIGRSVIGIYLHWYHILLFTTLQM